MPTLSLLFNFVLEVIAQNINQEKEMIRGTQIGKEEIKPPQSGKDIILYMEYPKEFPSPNTPQTC